MKPGLFRAGACLGAREGDRGPRALVQPGRPQGASPRVSLVGGHTGVDLLSALTIDIKYLAGSWVGLDDLQAGASENCCEVAENIFVP